MDSISLAFLDDISLVAVLALVALLTITDRLVWHTRLREANDRADRWEKVALSALASGARAGVRAAEVAVDVVSAMPDPASDQGE